MIIEKFKEGRVKEIYERFLDRGRLLPDGLELVSTCVTDDLSICYAIVKTESYQKLEEWMNHWIDLIDFEITSVVSSQEAAAKSAGSRRW